MADLSYAICLVGFAIATVWLSIIDIREQRLPNKIVWPLNIFITAMLGMHALLSNAMDAYLRALLAGAACFAVFFAMRFFSPSSMGFGDVKLSIAIGLMLGYLSWTAVVNAILIGFVAAAIFALVGLATKKLQLKGNLAFGPFMLFGAWVALLI